MTSTKLIGLIVFFLGTSMVHTTIAMGIHERNAGVPGWISYVGGARPRVRCRKVEGAYDVNTIQESDNIPWVTLHPASSYRCPSGSNIMEMQGNFDGEKYGHLDIYSSWLASNNAPSNTNFGWHVKKSSPGIEVTGVWHVNYAWTNDARCYGVSNAEDINVNYDGLC